MGFQGNFVQTPVPNTYQDIIKKFSDKFTLVTAFATVPTLPLSLVG